MSKRDEITIDAGAVRKETGEWQAVLVADAAWPEDRALAFARRLAVWASIEVRVVEVDYDARKDRLVAAGIGMMRKLGVNDPEKAWDDLLHAIDLAGWMAVPQEHVDEMREAGLG